MEAAIGFSTHSGWAVNVNAGLDRDGRLAVVDRGRVGLVDGDLPRQAYHAAAGLAPGAADALVARVDRAIAARAEAVLGGLVATGGDVTVVAIAVVGDARDIPDVATDLASHARTHACEVEQYRRRIVEAAGERELRALRIGTDALADRVADDLGWTPERVGRELAAARVALGPPWQQDHKRAALAALLARRP